MKHKGFASQIDGSSQSGVKISPILSSKFHILIVLPSWTWWEEAWYLYN